MTAGNPHRRTGSGRLWLAFSASILFPGNLAAQEAKPSPLEGAEVEAFRFTPPPEDLVLDEAGVRKRQALLNFYRGISLEATDMPAALGYFKKVLELDPANVALAMEVATHCAVFGRFEEAKEILGQSLEKNPDNPMAYLNLSRFSDTHHNNDKEQRAKAIEYAQVAYERFPFDHVVIEHLVTLLVSAKKNDEAEAILEKCLAREKAPGGYWLAVGRIARQLWPLREGDNRKRISQIYERALRAEPENLATAQKVAAFYRHTGEVDRAIQIYEVIARRQPENLRARKELSDLYWVKGRREEATAGLEALLQIDPQAADVRRRLAGFYEEMEDVKNAMKHAEEVIRFGGSQVDDFIRLAQLQLGEKKLGAALQNLKQGVAVHPESPRLNYFLGMVYLDVERFGEAFEAFEGAEKFASAALPSLLTEGFYFQYAMAAERSGDLEAAEKFFRKSIELVEDDNETDKAKSLNYLGYMWLEQEKNIDEAGEMIIKANELIPDNGAYLDSLGWFYYLKGDYPKAIENLEKAEKLVEEEPDSVVFEHLGWAHLKNGDVQEAKEYFERSLEIEPERKEELEKLREAIEGAES